MPATQAKPAPPPLSGWQQRASQFFCLLMVFAFPIFSVPCHKGTCTSPLDVVATYAHVKCLLSEDVIKGILFPATTMQKMEVLVTSEPQNFAPPQWNSVLSSWNLTADMVEKDDTADNIEFSLIPNIFTLFDENGKTLNWNFVGACTICLLGGVFSIAGPNKYSMWGILLVFWYIYLDGGTRSDVFAQPMYLLAFICSLGWINFKNFFTLPPVPKAHESFTTTAETKTKAQLKKKQ